MKKPIPTPGLHMDGYCFENGGKLGLGSTGYENPPQNDISSDHASSKINTTGLQYTDANGSTVTVAPEFNGIKPDNIFISKKINF